EDGGDLGRVDHGRGDVDLLRGREALHAGGDVDGLAEIILSLVEHDGETRPLVNAGLDHEVLAAARGIEVIHPGAHPQAGSTRTPAWLSSCSRSGPGRMVMLPVGGCALL